MQTSSSIVSLTADANAGMSFPYKKILVIGATSGIGEALAERLIQNGHSVIVAGRRKEKLNAFVSKHEDKATGSVFDVLELENIPRFAADIAKAHPDLDCVILNSGIQRGFDFSKPETVDLSMVNMEMTTNYTSFIHLTIAFLPHLQKQHKATSLIYVTSGLALVPIARCANYCASKAALHSYILALRQQLKDGPGNVKVVEIMPPAVQTELHDAKHQPDIKNGGQMGMPLDQFTDETWEKLSKGDEQIPIGEKTVQAFEGFERARQKMFMMTAEQMKKTMA